MPWGKPNITEETIQCSLVKSPVTFLEPIAKQKIQVLMEAYSHQEWIAYLCGRILEKENIFVEDISVPPHTDAGGGCAEAEPFHTPKDCVGIIHSHHSMGAFHSGTDQAYVDKNFPVSITVARNGEGNLSYDAVSYRQTPCGKNLTVKSTIKYVQPPSLFDKEKFLKGARENIDKAKKVYVRPVGKIDPYGGFGANPSGFLNDPDGKKRRAAKESPFVPIRYRLNELLGSHIIDSQSRVISKKEWEDIVHNSQEVDD